MPLEKLSAEFEQISSFEDYQIKRLCLNHICYWIMGMQSDELAAMSLRHLDEFNESDIKQIINEGRFYHKIYDPLDYKII